MSAEEKILKFIFMQKKRWDHIKSTKSDTVPIDMTRQDIANYLGMTIETVSRTFTNLSKKNIISLQSHSIKIL
jgi:CRP/FNR family transcriptional regulator